MKCVICSKSDWENVDEYRIKPQDMCICKRCGFVTYPKKTVVERKDYYHEDYRQPPGVGNLYTGLRKLKYHEAFLKEFFPEWQKKESFEVFEIGAAYGMFLHWLKTQVPKASVSGTEWTKSFRHNAWHEFGIDLGLDFDTSKNYDLIATYKVAEHQLDVRDQLNIYREHLNENGLLYISVPTWFNRLSNFGVGGFDVEYYYHPDHVNVWTKEHFEWLLQDCGFEIIKFDGAMYNETYMCKPLDKWEVTDPPNFYKKIKEDLAKIKNAANALEEQRFADAIQIWPDFPQAWTLHYEFSRASLHKEQDEFKAIQEFISRAMDACENSAEIALMSANILMRYNKYQKAADILNHVLKLRPEDGTAMMMLSNCLRFLSEKAPAPDKEKLLIQARNICRHIKNTCPQSMPEAINWIYQDNARLPIQKAQKTE